MKDRNKGAVNNSFSDMDSIKSGAHQDSSLYRTIIFLSHINVILIAVPTIYMAGKLLVLSKSGILHIIRKDQNSVILFINGNVIRRVRVSNISDFGIVVD